MRVLALGMVGGVLVGSSGWVADHGPPLVQWTSAIAAVWLLGAFSVGALSGHRIRAAAGGALTIIVGVATYYVLFHFVSNTVTLRYGVIVGVGWATLGTAIGAVLGWAGDAWRRGRAIGPAIVGGALTGEAMLLLSEWHNRTARAVLLCELVFGAMLPFALARKRLVQAVALTAVVAMVVLGLESSIRDAMRAAGWRGA
jgi:hypothetical protein